MSQIITKKIINDLTYQIIGAAIEVHKVLGPGLLESNYEKALIHELSLRGLHTKSQQTIQVPYKEILLDCELRYDILVEDLVIVENKAVLDMHPIFEATLLTYMKHLKIPKGILINFHVLNIFNNGQKTFVNEYFRELPDS
ncbi:GxxExxY protein [Runella defluvii]|uniref:GxxExxY protein n=1 Tax=Runella defluvii TaxID=370973 RepID=A0A7W5ZIH0_9BACT|nr:GxxExxY protein [Runella defluvii]MBB3837771.1 GxxExxY protein [Runella defluvii]